MEYVLPRVGWSLLVHITKTEIGQHLWGVYKDEMHFCLKYLGT